jgi:flagellar FliJ protein
MFHFRFEALLSARRHTEEIFQKELSEARRALSAEQAVLREKTHARRQCLQAQRRQQGQCFRGSDMLLYTVYLQRLERDIAIQQKRVSAAERQAGQKRQALVEAMKKRKILEKLKEKDQEIHLRSLSERERKFLDEVAARTHAMTRSA